MNPLLQQALLSILRWAMAILAGYLVKAGIWTASDATTYVAAGSLALISLVWTQRAIIGSRLKLLMALMHPELNTENEVKAKIAEKKAAGEALPTLTTPANTAPGVPAGT